MELWGNKKHFDYINQEIDNLDLSEKSDEKLVVYRTHGYKTIDGIDVCGLRVAHEIMDQIKTLNKEGHHVTKFSIVGYSLGGLISRYAIGILYHQNYFQSIKPVNFITFCTPHVGVLTPGSNISVKIFNNLVPNLLSLSGKQMFLKDSSGLNQNPLLSLMASPTSVFYKALESFKYRSLYANAINDKRTSWWTAGISIVDPFINIDENSSLNDLNYNFIKSYEPIILDSMANIVISNRKISIMGDDEKEEVDEVVLVSNFWERKWRWVVVAFNLLFFAPLWVLWFILSGIMESFKSHRRINTTLRENSGFFASLTEFISDEPINLIDSDEDEEDDEYDFTTPAESIRSVDFDHNNFEKSLHDQADTLMESLWDAMTSKDELESAKYAKYDIKHHTPVTIEEDDEDYGKLEDEGFKATISELSFFEKDSEYYKSEVLSPFILNLTNEQLEIIKNLNNLTWNKFPLLIRHTKSTHSAAIVRDYKDATLYEGKVVIKHWLDNVFQLD
ncbi:unnamed protein product [Wickerhamomyces anomalus]